MTNKKTIIQDVLNTVLVFALVGTGIISKLQPLVSEKTLSIINLCLGAALLLVYQADVIFGFSNTNIPTPPTV